MLRSLIWRMKPRFGAMKARLTGVAGFSGYGALYLTPIDAKRAEIDIGVIGAAGRSARVFGDGTPISELALKKGEGFTRIKARFKGKMFGEGALIEIQQNGETILAGELRR